MPKQDENAFGKRLAQLRDDAGLTQAALAKAAGMHKLSISQIEQGRRQPSWETVKSLCAALGVKCTAFDQDAAMAKPAKRKGKG